MGDVRIKLLEGHHGRFERRNHVGHAAMDFEQPIGKRLLRRPADDAGFDDFWLSLGAIQHAVAGDVETGVDAEDAGGRRMMNAER